jgi:hypothetical protein
MTERERLQDLEARLATARPGHEAEMVEEAARVLANETTYRVDRFREAGAFADAAMLVYRAALPDSGFQFGFGPNLGARPRRATALVWQRGDACAMPYIAATPALALLRAAVTETSNLRDRDLLAGCPICCGLGWYVTADNRKQMCRHSRGMV